MAYLCKTLGKKNEEVSEILFKKSDDGTLTEDLAESALSTLEGLHASHVSASEADTLKTEYDKGHKAGKFETLSQLDKELETAYGVTGKNTLERIAAVAKKAAEEAGTDEKVLTSVIYTQKVKELTDAIAEKDAAHEAAMQEVSAKIEKSNRFSKNMPKIDSVLEGMGAVFPENPTAKAKMKDFFFKNFDEMDFKDEETGTYVVGPDGKMQKDAHGHPLKLEDYTATIAKDFFDFKKQDSKHSAGAEDGSSPMKWTKDNLPKTREAFEDAYYKTDDPKQRSELTVAYQAALQANN